MGVVGEAVGMRVGLAIRKLKEGDAVTAGTLFFFVPINATRRATRMMITIIRQARTAKKYMLFLVSVHEDFKVE